MVSDTRLMLVNTLSLCASLSITAPETRLLGRRVVVLGRGLKVPVAAHVRVLARQEAPLIWAQEVKAPAVEVCDFLVAVDCVAENVALYLDEE